MSVFSKKSNPELESSTTTAQLMKDITKLLDEIKSQTGGNNSNALSELNHLLSELKGSDRHMSRAQLLDYAMKGGAVDKKSKKVKSKKAGSKNRSKSKKEPDVKKEKNSKKSKSKSKSLSKSKRSMKRAESNRSMGMPNSETDKTEKKKKVPHKSFLDMIALKAFIKSKLPNETLNNMGALSTVVAKLMRDNDKDLDKAKKTFNSSSFLKDYAKADAEGKAKKAAKKASKN